MTLAGGLRINIPDGETHENAQHAYTVVQTAIDDLIAKGISFPPQASYPGFPDDITTYDDQQLGKLMSQLSTYINYVDRELALAECQRDATKAYAEFVTAKARITIRKTSLSDPAKYGPKLHVKDKEDLVNTDPNVVAALGEALKWETMYRLTKTVRDAAQRQWDTASRRITQRGQEVDRMRRETNVHNAPLATNRWSQPQRG